MNQTKTAQQVAAYIRAVVKREVGNMPDRLKLLKKQIDQVENPKLNSDEEDI